jgi:integrase
MRRDTPENERKEKCTMPPHTRYRLTAAAIKTLKFEGKPFKKSDGGGLYLHVQDSGLYWRLKYMFQGREKLLALGVYPEVSLSDARGHADEARSKVANGIDPVAERRADKDAKRETTENSVEAVAREWYNEVHQHRVVEVHHVRNLRRLECYIFPKLGLRPITEVTPPQLLEVLRAIEKAGKIETASRVKTLCGQVWRYAISTGRAERDIAADLRDCLKPAKVKHHPAIIDPDELAKFLLVIDGYAGFPAASAGLRLSPLIFCRPGELRQMLWEDIDLKAGTWHYKPSKGGGEMIVPLPRQATEILEYMEPISGGGKYVFPSVRSDSRPMSENTINAALANMGYKGRHTAHGFRATARTILEEHLGFDRNVTEMQLAHQVRDANGRAYNRTTLLEQRKEMLQAWADYLDELRAKASASMN